MQLAEKNLEQVQVQAFRPNIVYRFWRAMGFRHGAFAGRPDDDEARYTIHTILSHWDWRDRLRILISGDTATEICVETKAIEEIKGVRTEAVVLAPGARRERWPGPQPEAGS